MEKGLYKSALDEVVKVHKHALANKDYAPAVKAIMYRFNRIALNEDEHAVFDSLQQDVNQLPQPAKSAGYAMIANMYRKYYTGNRRMRNRTRTAVVDNDIKTWDITRLFEEALKYYTLSIQDETILQQTPLDDYKTIVEYDENTTLQRIVFPTLYDFLTFNAIEAFQSETSVVLPQQTFVLNKLEYFADVNTFVNYRIETPDSLSAEYNVISLYQKLLKFRLQKNDNPAALISLNIERLKYVYDKGRYVDNAALYDNALKSLLDTHSQSDEWVYPAYAMAVQYERQGNNDQKNGKYKESYDLCTKIISQYSGKDEVKVIVELARKLQKKIASPVLNVTLNSLHCSDSPILALVKYKNTDRLRLKIYSTDEEYLFKRYKVETGEFENKKPFAIKEIALPATNDFQQHSAEIMIDGLPQGCYIIFVENTSGFAKNDNSEYSVIQVSPLNVAFQGNTSDSYYNSHIYVANAKTGEPLKNAKIDYYVNDVKVNTYRTEDDGLAYINVAKNEGFKKAIITHGTGRLVLDKWNVRSSSVETARRQTVFFTDRSIYRPGQTVYYKALYLERHKGKYTLLKNESITIDFRDVNNKVIATHTHKTNDYGSVQGSFAIPQGLLNGTMRLSSEYGTQSIRVEEYKRPTFEVEFDTLTKTYRLNDSIQVAGKAKALAGYAVDNAKVQYRIIRNVQYRMYRWWFPPISQPSREIASGVINTDNKGEFVINFKAEADDVANDNLIYNYIVTADVTDVNGETRSAELPVRISKKPLLVETLIPDRIIDRKALDFIIQTTNLDGNLTPADLLVTVTALESPEGVLRSRLWEVPDTSVMSRREFKKHFPLDPYGNEDKPDTYRKVKQITSFKARTTTSQANIISLNTLADAPAGWYRIDIKAKNADGIEVEYDKSVHLSPSPSPQGRGASSPIPQGKGASLQASQGKGSITDMSNWLTIIKTSAEPGEYAEFWVGGSEEKSYIHYDIVHQNRIVERKNIIVNNAASGSVLIPVTEEHRGGFTVQFLMIQNGRTYTESCHVDVPFTNKQLDITFKTFRNKLLPGEKEKWTLNVKNKKGERETAEMVATLYDASLDAFSPHSWNKDFYAQYYSGSSWYPFYRNIYTFGFFQDYSYYINDRIFAYPRFDKFGNDNLPIYGIRGLSSRKFDFNEVTEVAEESVVVAFGTQKKATKAVSVVAVADQAIPNAVAGTAAAPQTPQKILNSQFSILNSITTRRNFNETAFFYPQLMTDENGDISIEFTVPEALTRWKMLGFAHTLDFKIGSVTNELITQKQVAISANAPRFFRENDIIEFTAKVNNITDGDLTGQAMLRLYDASTMQPVDAKIIQSPQTQSFDVKGGQSAGLKWTLIIPDNVSAISYKLTAQAGNHTDGEEKIVPVIKNSVLVTETMPFNVRGGKQKSLTFTKLKENKSSTLRNHSLTLELTSNPAWYAVQAMPYLMEYPYECSEQTFSRFYANSLSTTVVNSSPRIKQVFDMWRDLPEYKDVLLSNLEKNQELKQVLLEETPWVMQAQNESERKKRVALLFDLNRMSAEQSKAFDKVKKAQQNDGGFPWFTGAPSSYFITSHIISGFEHLKKLNALGDFADAANIIITKGLSFLDGEILDKYEKLLKYEVNMKQQNIGYEEVKYLYTCSFSKHKPDDAKAFDYYFDQAKQYWPKFNLQAQAMIALAMHRFGDVKMATAIIRSLKERSQQSDEMGMYWKDNVAGYFWYQASIETQALLIEAFNEAANDNKAVEEMKIWLLRNKQTNDWRTTKATAEACYALLMTGNNLLDDNQALEVTIGGKPLKDVAKEDVRPEPGTGYMKTSWSGADVNASMANLTVSNPNKSGISCGGAYYWQYFEQLDKISGSETSLRMNKQLFLKKITVRGAELQPLNESNVLQIGDIVTVRMELRADRDYEFVHLKDMRAAGFEPTKTLSGYRHQDGLWYYESIKDASTNFFITYLRKGTYVFEYDLRVTHAGQFSNGITTFQCMYAPEFSAHSEGIRIKVK
ncbi:MAG: hypothetical protein LBS43_01065 [Prevotellaceae bacterium]|jgi:uncharacterized protein YfaS (alpha-2-macroglobulin family)|nr:hypothetical protein [Prevotellaceae bacterium]